MAQSGMLHEEGREPVGEGVEEAEALHQLEAAEIDVGALLLHVENLVDVLLGLFHALVGGIGVEYVFHGVFVLLNAPLGELEA